jgi:hypothetical protein
VRLLTVQRNAGIGRVHVYIRPMLLAGKLQQCANLSDSKVETTPDTVRCPPLCNTANGISQVLFLLLSVYGD